MLLTFLLRYDIRIFGAQLNVVGVQLLLVFARRWSHERIRYRSDSVRWWLLIPTEAEASDEGAHHDNSRYDDTSQDSERGSELESGRRRSSSLTGLHFRRKKTYDARSIDENGL